MGRLTDGMENLRNESDTLRQGRAAFILDVKEDVAELKRDVLSMRSGFVRERAEATGLMREELSRFVSGVREHVAELRSEAGKMQEDMREGHGVMANNLRESLSSFISELESSVATLVAGFRKARVDNSERLQDELRRFVSDMQGTVAALRVEAAEFQASARDDHDNMASELKLLLGSFVAELKATVEELSVTSRNELADTVAASGKARQDFIAAVGKAVGELREKTVAMQREYADDIGGARRAWAGMPPSSSRNAEKAKPVPRQRSKDVKTEIKGKTAPVEAGESEIAEDDLTLIKGIGPGRRNLLNNGGIYTFVQLAAMDLDRLHEITGDAESRVLPVESWIEQAKELAG